MGERCFLKCRRKAALADPEMTLGTWLHLTERHEHRHEHEEMEHSHEHVHDEHHLHAHDYPVSPGTKHSHRHRHEPRSTRTHISRMLTTGMAIEGYLSSATTPEGLPRRKSRRSQW